MRFRDVDILPCLSHSTSQVPQLPFSSNNINWSYTTSSFKMARLLTLAALSTIASASAIQQPLHESSNSQAPIAITSKPLVSTEALQADIERNGLLKRAEKLFEIAQLGKKEYNHPTRVIGSDGTFKIPDQKSHFRSS